MPQSTEPARTCVKGRRLSQKLKADSWKLTALSLDIALL
jgi:hypothetical protein